jgi:hypothetical protein
MDSSTPNSRERDACSEARIQRLRDTLSASTARIVAAISHYIELNNRALAESNLGVLRRLDSVEARLSAVEKRLNISPTA